MKLTIAVWAFLLGAVFPQLARADRRVPTYRELTPSQQAAVPVLPNVSHVIYLNNCEPNGCTIMAGGTNDSTHDISTVPQRTSQVSAYTGTSANWDAIVQCVRQTYSPFDVQIVTDRPATGDYHMAIVAGHAADIGEGEGVLGVSAFFCGNYIPNSISFSFANEEPTNIDDICWTVSQETAHAWGLDHKFDNRDPMTYLSTGPAIKSFQDEAGDCGEFQARSCMCDFTTTGGSPMQENSFQHIIYTFGSSAPDTVAPTVHITSPTTNDTVMQPNFTVTADVADDRVVEKAELRIDGTLISSDASPPYSWTSPHTLSQGRHRVEVKAFDHAGNSAADTVTVDFGDPCSSGKDCPNPTTDACVDQHCVAGMTAPGGLGATCNGNSDCDAKECGDDGAGHKFCVVGCDPTAQACPSGFGCTSAGADESVCWPGANNGGGGGCTTNGAGGATFLVLGLGAFLFARKRS